MSVKKLLNSPEKCVDEGLYGLSRSYPGLVIDSTEKTFYYKVTNERRKCAVLSGGGSGHEPFPSGYVGEGMLAASVSGAIFTSPPKRQIFKAIEELSEMHDGVLLIVPNYTGDRLNFGIAQEAARRQGIKVDSLVVGEDIAQIAYGMEGKSGRRGMCGLILVLKIAGYLSKEGKCLEEIKEFIEKLTEQIASIGVSLEACSLPGSELLFSISQDEMDLGVGVHGEAGVRKMKLKSAKETVEMLLQPLVEHLNLSEKDEVVALVNNLGCLSQIEQWIVTGELSKQMLKKKITIIRMYTGLLFTSLNMIGVQICLLKVTPYMKEILLQALDDPTNAPAWPGTSLSFNAPISRLREQINYSENIISGGTITDDKSKLIEQCLVEGSKLIIENEEKMNILDSGCGDGDCGTTISRLAKEILHGIRYKRFKLSHPAQLLSQLSEIAEGSMGGTSGAIYSLFFTGASTEFSLKKFVEDAHVWSKAWVAGIELIKKYSDARIGDRTLMDALEPGCDTFQRNLEKYNSGKKAFTEAVESARIGCSKTQNMKAAIGRASYVESSQLKEVDAGAFAITLWLDAFHKVINSYEN